MELLNQRAKRLACQRGQSHITGIFDDGNQFLHLRRPLSDDQSELRTVAAKRIVGRVTASQIASASAASFLFVLTKGRTY